MLKLSTITREQLIDATELTLERAARYCEVPVELAAQVREVARTATRITPGWWNEEYQCGCLIGTLFGPNALDILEQMEEERGADTGALMPEDAIACCFPGVLRNILRYETLDDVYRVID